MKMTVVRPMLVLLGVAGLTASVGCRGLTGGGPDEGSALQSYQARDGAYFPKFIKEFFPATKSFARDNPTLAQARSGVTMIQIKQLTADRPGEDKANEANLSWSADGVYLGYEIVESGFRKIMLNNLAGDYTRELQMIPKGRNNFLDGMVVRSAHSYNAGLRWSQDSTRFAFMSNGGVGQYNIYVGSVGQKEKPVAKSPTKDGYATWNPVKNEIAFVSGRSGNGDIYLIKLEDREVARLSSSAEVDIFPEWFPDGDRLVYASGDALDHDLVMVERASDGDGWTKPRALTNWDRDQLRPTVSPNGRYVAFYVAANDKQHTGRRWDIHVVPVQRLKNGKTKVWSGPELRRMAIARDVVIDLNTGPAWSPDSRKIFYVKRDPTVFNPIYAYDLFSGRKYRFKTGTRMNRDILMSKLGILSFRAQVGVWDRVYVALTNQGLQMQSTDHPPSQVHYLR